MTQKLFIALTSMFMLFGSTQVDAQVYDENQRLCKFHPNYVYEQEWRATPTSLALARICISEEGYRLESGGPTNGCIAIYNVFKTRNRFISSSDVPLEAMRAYSPNSFDYSRTDSTRRYIPYLNEHGDKPLYWPYSDEAWEERREVWLNTLRLAERLISGTEEIPSPCAGTVHHWAANREDMIKRALSNNLRRIHCRDVKNAFWQI